MHGWGYLFKVMRFQNAITYLPLFVVPYNNFLQCRYNGTDTGSNLHVYMNGILRPEDEVNKNWAGSSLPKTEGFSGTLELGSYQPGIGQPSGNMWVDEFLIFEEELPSDDVLRLYQAYP